MARQPQAKTPPRPMLVIWVSIAVVGMLVFSLPTVMLLLVGMLPTLGAYIVDRTKEKYATFSVASMNFCGVFPYMMDLWINAHTIRAASNMLTDVFILVIMYGSAAFGWIIFSTVPPVITSFLAVLAQRRVAALRAQQRSLIEEWGEMVAHQANMAAMAEKELHIAGTDNNPGMIKPS